MEPVGNAVAQATGVSAVATAVLLLAALGGGSVEVRAADEPSWAYELWHDLMSPYCPGRTLAECPSPQADELRIWILTQSAAGATREEVEESLYERFGDEIRTTPKAEGWGLAAYVIPVVAFVFFGGIVALALRRLTGGSGGTGDQCAPQSERRREPSVSPAPIAVEALSDAELERRVDEELNA